MRKRRREVEMLASVNPDRLVNTNTVGDLQWLNGTSWMLNNSAQGISYLLLSRHDGTTWTDITRSGAINSSCTGTSVSSGVAVNPHYVYARCQNGRVYWKYGPI